MTREDAEALIGRVCRNEVGLGFTDHFWVQAGKRFPGLQRQQVYNILRSGRVVDAPVRDGIHRNHTVKVRATLSDFGPVELVAAVSDDSGLFCITIYGLQ